MGTHHRSEIGTLIEEVGERIGKNLTVSNCQGQTGYSVEHIKISGVPKLNYSSAV